MSSISICSLLRPYVINVEGVTAGPHVWIQEIPLLHCCIRNRPTRKPIVIYSAVGEL